MVLGLAALTGEGPQVGEVAALGTVEYGEHFAGGEVLRGKCRDAVDGLYREDRRRVDCEVDLDRVAVSARDESHEGLVPTSRFDIPTCTDKHRAEHCGKRSDISG